MADTIHIRPGETPQQASAEAFEQHAQQNDAELRAIAGRAVQKNPGLNPEIFGAIVNAQADAERAFHAEMLKLEQPTAGGLPPDRAALEKIAREKNIQYHEQVHQGIVSRYGPQGEMVWKALGKEISDENDHNPVHGVVKQFYNEDKGGFQWGGAIGAVVGLLTSTMFAGTGTWMGVLAMAVTTLAGAWLGNKASELLTPEPPAPDPLPVTARSPAASPATQPTVNIAPHVLNQARNSASGLISSDTGETMTTGNLAPPSIKAQGPQPAPQPSK